MLSMKIYPKTRNKKQLESIQDLISIDSILPQNKTVKITQFKNGYKGPQDELIGQVMCLQAWKSEWNFRNSHFEEKTQLPQIVFWTQHACLWTHMHVHTHTHRDRERERVKRDRDRHRKGG